jgi:hypothetical protein
MKHISRALILCTLGLVLAAAPARSAITETTIYAVQVGAFAINDTVVVDSVVVIGVDIRPGTYGVYVQEPLGGPYSGILAYLNTTYPTYTPPSTVPAVGDLVTVQGRYAEFNGLSELDFPTLTLIGTTTPIVPVKLPVDSLKTSYPGSEGWEGVLVRVDSVKVTSLNAFRDWRFHMTTGPLAGRVDSLVAYEKMISGQVVPEVGDIVNVVGVGDYAFGERRVAPRNDNDITFLTPAPAPVPNLAYSPAENKIKVRFNVALNSTDAQTTSKYSLSTLQPITLATYDNPTKTVTLTVGSNLVPAVTPHVLSMTGIRNSQNVNMVGTQNISFIGGIATISFVQTPKSASNDTSQVVNQQVTIRGVVTETTGGATPDYPASIGGFYLQQRGAVEYGGVFVFGPPITPVKGDSVLVSGLVTEFGTGPETEITGVDEVTILASNRPAIQPVDVSIAHADGNPAADGEKYEAMLVRVAGAKVLSQGGPGTPFDVATTLTGPDTLMVDDLAVEESAYIPWRGDTVDVTGIIRYSGTAPFRRLQPRNWNEPPTGDIHVVSKADVSDVPVPAARTALLQNHPNPFNPSTRIDFTLAEAGPATVRIYDVHGKLVATVFDAKGQAGPNAATWNGLDLAGRPAGSGIYFYRLVAGDRVQARKMVLLK